MNCMAAAKTAGRGGLAALRIKSDKTVVPSTIAIARAVHFPKRCLQLKTKGGAELYEVFLGILLGAKGGNSTIYF